jgi:hypothetical protein
MQSASLGIDVGSASEKSQKGASGGTKTRRPRVLDPTISFAASEGGNAATVTSFRGEGGGVAPPLKRPIPKRAAAGARPSDAAAGGTAPAAAAADAPPAGGSAAAIGGAAVLGDRPAGSANALPGADGILIRTPSNLIRSAGALPADGGLAGGAEFAPAAAAAALAPAPAAAAAAARTAAWRLRVARAFPPLVAGFSLLSAGLCAGLLGPAVPWYSAGGTYYVSALYAETLREGAPAERVTTVLTVGGGVVYGGLALVLAAWALAAVALLRLRAFSRGGPPPPAHACAATIPAIVGCAWAGLAVVASGAAWAWYAMAAFAIVPAAYESPGAWLLAGAVAALFCGAALLSAAGCALAGLPGLGAARGNSCCGAATDDGPDAEPSPAGPLPSFPGAHAALLFPPAASTGSGGGRKEGGSVVLQLRHEIAPAPQSAAPAPPSPLPPPPLFSGAAAPLPPPQPPQAVPGEGGSVVLQLRHEIAPAPQGAAPAPPSPLPPPPLFSGAAALLPPPQPPQAVPGVVPLLQSPARAEKPARAKSVPFLRPADGLPPSAGAAPAPASPAPAPPPSPLASRWETGSLSPPSPPAAPSPASFYAASARGFGGTPERGAPPPPRLSPVLAAEAAAPPQRSGAHRVLSTWREDAPAAELFISNFYRLLRAGDLDSAAALLARAPGLALARKDGTTPLHAAVGAKSLLLVQLLVRAGADAHAVDGSGRTPAEVAAHDGAAGMAAWLEGVMRVE